MHSNRLESLCIGEAHFSPIYDSNFPGQINPKKCHNGHGHK